MKTKMKRLINGILGEVGLRMISRPKHALTGLYLFEDLRILMQMEAPLCLDIGANTGQTIDALLQVFRASYVHAFEPSSVVFHKLQAKSYARNVELHHCAMGSELGERQFLNYADSCLSSLFNLSRSGNSPFVHTSMLSAESVRIETVDHFLDARGISNLNLLKIDTQGFEGEILSGARRSLDSGRISFVSLEMNFINLYEGQASAIALMNSLHQAGFQLLDFYEKAMRHNRMAWCTALFGRA